MMIKITAAFKKICHTLYSGNLGFENGAAPKVLDGSSL